MYKHDEIIPENLMCKYSKSLHVHPYYHKHNGIEIYLFINGEANYYIEKSCYNLNKGSLLLIQPNEYHRIELIDKAIYERITINIQSEYLSQLSTLQTNLSKCFFDRPFGKQNLIQLSEHDLHELIILTKKICTSYKSSSYGQDILTRAYILEILTKINLLYSHNSFTENQNIMPPLIRDAISYIENNITDSITLADLSKNLFHNATYISRKFKIVTGLNIQQFIIHKRITIAQTLLRDGVSVTDACYQSGFNNYSNFSRTFSNHVGCSPKKYQTKHNSL